MKSHAVNCVLVGIGVRDEFRSGAGGGGWSLLPERIFSHCLHENQVVLPEYYLIFCPKMATWKILLLKQTS